MKAAIIRITDFSVNFDRTDIRKQIDDIVDDLDIFEWAEFHDQESFNMLLMKTLMESIPQEALERPEGERVEGDEPQLKYNIGATVSNIYECRDYLYAAYFVSLEDVLHKEAVTEEEFKNAKVNIFGSQICSAHVASDVVIVKHDLSYDVKDMNVATMMSTASASQYTLVSDLTTIFLHRGVVIESNGSTAEYHYIQNPLENIIMTDNEYEAHYRYHEYEVFNHQISVFVDVRCDENNSELNEKASKITGAKVYGRALVSLSKRPEFNETPAFADLTDERLEAIIFLRERSTEITDGIAKSEKAYMNFDKVLELAKKRFGSMPVQSITNSTEVLNHDK